MSTDLMYFTPHRCPGCGRVAIGIVIEREHLRVPPTAIEEITPLHPGAFEVTGRQRAIFETEDRPLEALMKPSGRDGRPTLALSCSVGHHWRATVEPFEVLDSWRADPARMTRQERAMLTAGLALLHGWLQTIDVVEGEMITTMLKDEQHGPALDVPSVEAVKALLTRLAEPS